MAKRQTRKDKASTPGPQGNNVEFGRLSGHVGYQLRRAFFGSNQYFKQLLGPEGIAPGQYSIFSLICHNEGINQKTLAAIRKVDQSTIVPTLHHLEESGWIKRVRRPPDRRVAALVPTPAGKRKLAKLNKVVEEHEKNLTSQLTPAEKKTLLELLGRIVDTPLP